MPYNFTPQLTTYPYKKIFFFINSRGIGTASQLNSCAQHHDNTCKMSSKCRRTLLADVNVSHFKEDQNIIWATTWDFQQYGMCDQQGLRSACTYAQSDLSLCLLLEYSMSVKLLTEHHLEFLSLKRGCTGSSESTLVKMPHCWKSHVMPPNLSGLNHPFL